MNLPLNPRRRLLVALELCVGAGLCIGTGSCVRSQGPPSAETPADASAAASRDATDSGDLVVGTWNLEWFFDEHAGDNYSELSKQQTAPNRQDWNWRRDAVAASIAEAAPNIMALQEIEGQRVLYYLSSALERNQNQVYRTAFVEGSDYFTEQDVGFLVRDGMSLTRIGRREPSLAMRESKQYWSVSKHAEAVVEVPAGDSVEQVTVVTIHLRARAEVADVRTRQARLVHAWLADAIAAGENVIVLGDANSETTDYPASAGSDMAALSGLDTPSTADDLVDLGRFLPPDQQRTHLLAGKHYDRILVSPALLEDAPDRADLVFQSIERRQDLAVRGQGVDSPGEHWDEYWQMPAAERDLSDHWPVFATFTVR